MKLFFAQLRLNISLVAIAVLFSLFTLWMVGSPIKYALFVFEIFAIVILYFVLKNDHDNFNFIRFVRVRAERIFRDPYSDLLLISFSVVLIVVNGLHIEHVQNIQLLLSFITVSFLSGYSLLKIFKITQYFSRLEVFILSCVVSFILSGFFTLFLMSIDEGVRSILMPIFYVIIGSFSILQYIMSKRTLIPTKIERATSLSRNTDVLAIALAIIFYSMFYFFTYPNFAGLPGSDISRHFSDSLVLSRSPELYAQRTTYILFHAFEATLHSLSGGQQEVTSFQSIQILLNLLLPLSVYALAKRFLGNVDRRIPPISMIFYTILSNFSFVYFTQLKLLDTGSAELQLIGTEVAERAFNGTINFLQPFLWFEPLSVSFIMFIIAFLLLGIRHIPRTKFVPLYSILILAMYLTHPSEAIIFVVLIAIYAFISNTNKTLRLNEALFSSLLALLFAAVSVVLFSLVWTSALTTAQIPLNVLSSLVPSILFASIALFWRLKFLPNFKFRLRIIKSERFYAILSTVLVIVYLFGFQSWIFTDTFKTSTVYDVGVTPWFIYPLMLGIVGLLSILSIRFIPHILPNSGFAIIAASIVIIFILGRLVSFINVNYIITGYWEKRFLFFIFLLACLLAPIPLIRFSEQIKERTKKGVLANWSIMVVVCLIVLVGFSSMILQSVYWFAVTGDTSKALSKKEIQATDYLRNILEHDTTAFVITPTESSKMNLAFAAPGYVFSLPNVIFSSKYPEAPLMALGTHNLNHAYFYIHQRDLNFLKGSEGWLATHFLPILPVVFSNNEVVIYNASHVAYPAPKSDSTMVIPFYPRDNSWLYGYDIVSKSGKNYTVRYDTDPHALNSKNVILSFDPAPNYYSFANNFSSDKGDWTSISGKWKFSKTGLLAGDESIRIENILLSSISSRTFNATTSFSVNDLDPKSVSYASIVYSWIDPANYRYAGINIFNNDIYVHFATVNNGKTSIYPPWPGIKTNLFWKPGERFDLKLSVDAIKGLERLSLNGIEYLRQPNHGESGRLGLSYGRIHDLVFHSFKLEVFDESNMRRVDDYIKYTRDGGRLFILNTNGYGSIANYIINASTKYTDNFNDGKNMSIKYISSKSLGNISQFFPNKLLQSTSNILGVEAAIGRGKLTYLDIYPTLLNRQNNSLVPILSNLSAMLPMKPFESIPSNFKEIRGIFKEMFANGTIKVTTAATIFPSDIKYNKVVITTGKRPVSLSNVTNISIGNYDNVILNADNISFGNGRGLYARLIFGSNGNTHYSFLNLSFPAGMNTEISLMSNKGEILHFSNVSKVHIENRDPIYLYAREPNISINNGNITLNELYPLELYARGQASSKNLQIQGNALFSVLISDSFTFLSSISVDGTAIRAGGVTSFNEPLPPPFTVSKLYSLPPLVRVLVLIPFILAIGFILYGGPRSHSSVRIKET